MVLSITLRRLPPNDCRNITRGIFFVYAPARDTPGASSAGLLYPPGASVLGAGKAFDPRHRLHYHRPVDGDCIDWLPVAHSRLLAIRAHSATQRALLGWVSTNTAGQPGGDEFPLVARGVEMQKLGAVFHKPVVKGRLVRGAAGLAAPFGPFRPDQLPRLPLAQYSTLHGFPVHRELDRWKMKSPGWSRANVSDVARVASRDVAVFKPGEAKANEAKADAVIEFAKKVKDWPAGGRWAAMSGWRVG